MIKNVFNSQALGDIFERYMLNKKLLHSNHGVAHGLRTAILVAEIDKHISGEADLDVLLPAAAFHDIGRLDEGGDPDHGLRGASIVMKIMEELLVLAQPIIHDYQRTISEWNDWYLTQGKKIADIVGGHASVLAGDFYEMKVVIDADKLDRFRLAEEQWPDPKRFCLGQTSHLMDFAKELVNTKELDYYFREE